MTTSFGKARSVVLLAFLLFVSVCDSWAQCSGGTAAGALSPVPAAAYQTMAITTGNYYTFTVPASSGCSFPTYYFSFCPGDGGVASFDTQITILDNTGAYAGGYNDDNCGVQSYLVWTPTAAGTYRVLLNTYYCVGGNSATLAYRVASPPPSDPYFGLVDDAVSGGGGCVTLTTATNGQRGCAWDIDNTLNMLAPFSFDFIVNLGNSNAGADGMAFVIQNSPLGRCACGSTGGSLGAGGIPNSLIVEIDTYLNFEDRDDGMAGVLCAGGPEPDHLDIWLNGNVNPTGSCPSPAGARIIPAAVKLMNGAADYDIENGLNHILRISWAPGTPGTLTARLYNSTAATLYATVTYSFTAMTVFGSNTPFFGFTASTGGLNNLQTFCEPASLVLAKDEIRLDAQEEEDGSVNLSWNAPLGYSISYVERAQGSEGWKPLLTMPLQAGVVQEATDPSPMDGLYRYRVTMHDGDGNVKASNVFEMNLSRSSGLVLYPNPAEEQFHVVLPGGIESASLKMSDLSGRVVYERNDYYSGARISTTMMASGMYEITVVSGGQAHHGRIVVK